MGAADARTAAHNNAAWCGAVLAAHGVQSYADSVLWRAEAPPPPLYPGIVTLVPKAQLAVESCLSIRRVPLKDSFADLDLAPFGMRILIEADWLELRPGPDPNGLTATTDLEAWEAAWSKASLPERRFPDALADDPDLRFMARFEQGRPVTGGILNRAADVVGVTNVFGPPGEIPSMWSALCAVAGSIWPGLPCVTWEPRDSGPYFSPAVAKVLGPLRVWSPD